ncbi:sialate O-acetylesterase [Chryseobacterium ginsenosidimutans]|uniref:sialate O-acetylesterase n=1 Tax=Chryseobacterium ginsenosidimutans TaxID=687846 RepID=UPI0021679C75|nr:sialate O-acetylesterase [Chryseobacterium ginsenosidimutans]MCS3869600.1 sialate O-acetylesterase [Chryseobacterium ginsenosidimutans]
MNTTKFFKVLFFAITFCFAGLVNAKIKLPKLVSDGMVLQRDQKLKIWGQADFGEKIEVQFQNKKYNTVADNSGNWKIMLPEMKSGGPFRMMINEITLKNILIGDVYLCSGQSNMELPMRRVKTLYPQELTNANNSNIRFFTVPQKYDFKKAQNNLENGSWEETNPQNIQNFSAVAYFFAKEMYQYNKIPVGIINSSLGGSPVQAWMDENSLKKYPEYLAEAEKWRNDELIAQTESSEKALSKAWYAELDKLDIGVSNHWEKSDLNDSDWKKMNVPGSWEDVEKSFDGSVWFRKEIFLPKGTEKNTAFLNLGRIKDADVTYINGQKVGNVTYEYPPRWYDIPAGILKEGKNIIAVRITNGSGKGEFIKDKDYFLKISSEKFDLKGEWKYKIGAIMNRPAPGQTFIRWKPTGLYNAMLNPLTQYPIKAILWYQGESNTAKPQEYGDLLSTMILDWRNKWNQKDLPFFIVQLANFMEAKSQPTESNWAELREQQRKVSQTVQNTGLAVTIDIGEWNDIHPLNKKEVGKRLSLQAQKALFDKNIIADGPVYESMKIDGNKIILSFKKGTDDFSKVSELKGFAIKGNDGVFKWAKAKIEGNKIIVWNDEIKNPIAVRYDWADNPDGNLKNKNNLPASPFTTE